jgi:hypothetical protein
VLQLISMREFLRALSHVANSWGFIPISLQISEDGLELVFSFVEDHQAGRRVRQESYPEGTVGLLRRQIIEAKFIDVTLVFLQVDELKSVNPIAEVV